MLWPKIDTDEMGYLLAFTGTIRDEILDLEDLACHLIDVLKVQAPAALVKRYNLPEEFPEENYETLENMARKRGFLQGGGVCDTERMARVLMDEFRGGKLGRITLESPPEETAE